MFTLRQAAYQFRSIEAGGMPGPDFHITEAYAILLARQCLNMLIKPEYYDNRNQEDDRTPLTMFIATYEVTVQGTGNHRYLVLPEFFMRLPFNEGLKGIAPIKEPTREFIPRLRPEVTYNLPCADAEQQQTYYTEGLKVYFDKEIELGKVLVKLLVAAPDSLSEDSPLPIYPEQQIPMIAMMRQVYANKPIQDKVIDGNNDIGVRIPK